ncbi:hypothetical protein F2P81_016327 [Scophthalmus maximus]|nr:hypothetical protein F2P81_016327 [Scophthalmus maximus]
MKLLQESKEATKDRKFLKSQVEKRRRERMNCSLECLRNMLQEPQQLSETQHRVEKAEILEHTVHFLQNSAREDQTGAGGGGGQKHSFQDGFSTCLRRAAHFLGPQGKGLFPGGTLDTRFGARCSRSDSAGVQRRTEAGCSSPGSLTQTKSILRMLRQRSEHRLNMRASGADTSVHPNQRTVQQGFPTVPQQPQKQSGLYVRVASPAGKQGLSPSCPVRQTLWRPWP